MWYEKKGKAAFKTILNQIYPHAYQNNETGHLSIEDSFANASMMENGSSIRLRSSCAPLSFSKGKLIIPVS